MVKENNWITFNWFPIGIAVITVMSSSCGLENVFGLIFISTFWFGTSLHLEKFCITMFPALWA